MSTDKTIVTYGGLLVVRTIQVKNIPIGTYFVGKHMGHYDMYLRIEDSDPRFRTAFVGLKTGRIGEGSQIITEYSPLPRVRITKDFEGEA